MVSLALDLEPALGAVAVFAVEAARVLSRTVTVEPTPGRGGTAAFDDGAARDLVPAATAFSFSCALSAAGAFALAVIACNPPEAALTCLEFAAVAAGPVDDPAPVAPAPRADAPCEDASFFALSASSRSFAAALAAWSGTAGVDLLVEMALGRIGRDAALLSFSLSLSLSSPSAAVVVVAAADPLGAGSVGSGSLSTRLAPPTPTRRQDSASSRNANVCQACF